jgi:PAS domain S-box-containing protein
MSTPLTPDLVRSAAAAPDPVRSQLFRGPWYRELGMAATVFAAGMAATLLMWHDTGGRAARAAEARFEYRTERIRNELEQRLHGYDASLRSVAGLIGARPGFDRTHWRRYFDKAPLDTTHPGRLLVGFAPRVAIAERDAHEQAARADGLAGYQVRSQGAAARGESYPLAYVRKVADTPALPPGLDLLDDPVVAAGMERAAALARSVLAGPLAISRSTAEPDQIWLLLAPVFGGASVPVSGPERQAAVVGYLLEAFNPMDTAGSALGPDAKLIGLKVHDGELPLFTCPEMKRELMLGFRPTLHRASTLQFGERTWTLEFVALPGYLAQAEGDSQARFVLASGTLISLLLAGLMGAVARQRGQAVQQVAERTTALRDALARSEATEARSRAVIDHALDAIITVDARGLIQTFNPAAERTFGYRADEVIGHGIAMLMPAGDRDRHDDYMSHYLAGGPPRIIGIGREVMGMRKDSSTFPMELGVSDMQIGGTRYFCGIVRDVTQRRATERALQRERETLETRVRERTDVLSRTNAALEQEVAERRRIEAELVAAREQALSAAEAKAGFLANMSHEIRTPMNAVVGMSSLLEETALTPEQRGYVETIRVGGDALLAVINDILDFSKVESGMLELENRPFELGACIEEAFDMLAPRAAEKGIDLLYVLSDEVPRWISGDAARLRQVFVNLLSNAVKFTDSGEVCMTANLLGVQGRRARLQFAVRDTGIGITPEQRQHLFKAFSQADSSTTRKYGGTGLGLAICQRLTQMMGGDIGVESEDGRGSTFVFSITADLAEPGAVASRYVTESVPELAGKRVLLVDDNPTNLHILETQCRRWGMDVVSASQGAEALAVLDADRRFDAAVLDLHMPGMDGVQLAQQIRWLCPGTKPALVLLSSSAQRRGVGIDQAALFAARLAKPVKHSQLFATLSKVLGAARSDAAPVDPARRLDPTLARRLPLRVLVVEDSPINQKLAVGILAKLGYASDVAANGVEALELLRRHPYDLVFMDLQMPEMDGIEATRCILAEHSALLRPRIVAMTANALAGDRERCLAAGMDDYIAKPILPMDMQAIIERMAVRGPQPAAEADHEPSPLIDSRVVDELRLLDEPDAPSLLRGLMRDYLGETPGAIGEIKQFADRREATLVAQRAHRLGGVSASIGAAGMAEVCRRIEQQIAAGDLTSLPAMVDQLEMRFARTRAEMQRLT